MCEKSFARYDANITKRYRLAFGTIEWGIFAIISDSINFEFPHFWKSSGLGSVVTSVRTRLSGNFVGVFVKKPSQLCSKIRIHDF